MFSGLGSACKAPRCAFALLFVVALFNDRGLAAPPTNSWEFWITAINRGGRGGLPSRPDQQALEAPLPLWVDCELQWHFDRAKDDAPNPLKKRIVLRASVKDCRQSLLYWAQTSTQ
jgi:hypothetical protein